MKRFLFGLAGSFALACGVPAERKCEPGTAATCDGALLTTCIDVEGGDSFFVEQTCATGTTCDVPSGSCLPDGGDLGCGNGVIEAPEVCDDGDNASGDGCRGDCLSDESCGNGELDVDIANPEECDDDNNTDNDGCSANCELEFCGDGVTQLGLGEQCDDNDLLVCNLDCTTPRCGDGITGNSANEQCDDGNAVGNDNCANDCTINNAVTFCGDNVIQAPEQCDNGANNGGGNVCNDDCTNARCGDGITGNFAGEQCDDGNATNTDACANNCTVNIPAGCGNNILEAGEQCDDGNNVALDTCDPDCSLPACGNGITAEDFAGNPEACDDGNTNSNDGCSAVCLVELCGDGIQQLNEGCDDGTNDGAVCNPNCALPACGDGFLNPGEDCDDFGTTSGDGCDATCFFEGATCGDGVTEGSEQCDDGNTITGDGCTAVCLIEDTCGDGLVDVVVFSSPLSNNLGVTYGETRAGDFNGDGFQDISAIKGGVTIVTLGNGDGSFGAPIVSTTPNGFFSYEVGDMNNDGRDDIVGADLGNNTNTTFIANADGTFTSQSPSGIGAGPRFMALADVNLDGNLDAVTSNNDSSNITIALGNGNGNFLLATILNSGRAPHATAVADFNGDGLPDVVGAHLIDNSVGVFLQLGGGTFQAARISPTTLGPDTIAAGDVNGDGLQDVAVSTTGGADLLLGLGNGTFAAPISLTTSIAGSGQIEIIDLNGDGFDDIVTAKSNDNNLHIFFGNTRGVGGATRLPAGPTPGSISFADLNDDGLLDINSRTSGTTTNVHLALAVRNEECDDGNNINSDGCESDCKLICGEGSGAFGASFDANTGSCYLGFAGQVITWQQAEANCESQGGYLAVIDSVQENLKARQTTPFNEGPWIGFNDLAVEAGTNAFGFQKVTGGNLTFNGFGSTQPSNSSNNENCVHFFTDGAFGFFSGNSWNDNPCDNSTSLAIGFICELEPVSCGDGVVQLALGEECDDTINNGELCNFNCTLPRCGDGIEQDNEFCFVPNTLSNTNGVEAFESTAADLNNDGNLDLIVTNFGSATASVMLGNGDGTFGAPLLLPTGVNPINVATGDLNNDGILDVVVTNFSSPFASSFVGVGDGTFLNGPNIGVNGANHVGIALGDLNGDGNLDFAITSAGSSLIDINFGAPSVQAPINFPGVNTTIVGGAEPRTVLMIDVDGDGDLDLAVVNRTDNSVSVFNNNGLGSFNLIATLLTGGSGFDAGDIAAGFIDNDSLIDLVVVNSATNSARAFFGTGGGSFGAGVNIVTGNGPTRVDVEDLDHDGLDDVAITNFTDGTVQFNRSRGNGTFDARVVTPTTATPNGLVGGDFNNDGRADLAVIGQNFSNNTVQLHLGFGDGVITPTQSFFTENPASIIIADFNGDGEDDVATCSFGGNTISILRGNSTGAFGAPTVFAVTGVNPFELAVGDFDKDGDLDLATANVNGGSVTIMTNNGAANFTATATLGTGAGSRPHSIDAGDLDNDGDIDLVTVDLVGTNQAIFLNNGAGVFGAATFLATGANGLGVRLADLNNDGRLDLIASISSDDTVRISFGNGNGTFGASQNVVAGAAPREIAVADFDHDGDTDIATANSGSDNVSILSNNGSGVFAVTATLVARVGPAALIADDLDGDSDVDLIVIHSNVSGELSIFLGNGNGTFQAQQVISGLGNNASQVAAADINLDGASDLVVVVAESNVIRVFSSFFR